MLRNPGPIKISSISNIAHMNGKSRRQEPKATKKPKLRAAESTPMNFPAKQWNAAKFPAFISSAKLWTSPASSEDLISNGPGRRAPRPAAQYNLEAWARKKLPGGE